ncbi:MAG TPA: MFS transporter [Gaiella sp.]|jgi:FSR family fosmidomycin resistance protein-like MFS transporter|nr:MFS transporter [Gaiella sp.]
MRDELDRRAMVTLSGGHLAVDFASGSVPALLPFFTLKFDLSYTATAALMLAVLVSSSLVQPLFGLWSDRRGAMWLLPGGVAVAGVGTGIAAAAPSYALVVVLVFVAGIGIAAYHPEGAKFAAFASGRKRASGMSYFNIGGNTGYALGPIIVTPLVLWLGLGGGTLAMVPVLVIAALLLRALPALRHVVPVAGARRLAHGVDDVRAMSLLAVVIALRSVAWFGLLTFVPLWVVANGGTEGEGGRELSLMLVSGAVGTLVLGPVADRIGLRRTLLVTQALLPVLIVVFVTVGGAVGTLALMLVGLCVVGTFGVTMVLSQLYLPRHVGVASGLSVGLAMGLGGIAAVVLGAVADAVDLQTALLVGAAAPAIGCVVCLFLPPPVALPTPQPEPAAPAIV